MQRIIDGRYFASVAPQQKWKNEKCSRCFFLMAAFECLQSDVLAKLLDTAAFAAEKHRDQRRKVQYFLIQKKTLMNFMKDQYKTPYIAHPIGVSLLIARV